MFYPNEDFFFANRAIGRWDVPVLEFHEPECYNLHVPITGYIVNSSTERKDRLQSWKAHVAAEVMDARGKYAWNNRHIFAITLGFSFNTGSGWHGYRALDVENFIKPVIDALAAGLFCDEHTDPFTITRWDFDDSNFNTLLIHRLPDARTPQEEGIAVCVSAKVW